MKNSDGVASVPALSRSVDSIGSDSVSGLSDATSAAPQSVGSELHGVTGDLYTTQVSSHNFFTAKATVNHISERHIPEGLRQSRSPFDRDALRRLEGEIALECAIDDDDFLEWEGDKSDVDWNELFQQIPIHHKPRYSLLSTLLRNAEPWPRPATPSVPSAASSPKPSSQITGSRPAATPISSSNSSPCTALHGMGATEPTGPLGFRLLLGRQQEGTNAPGGAAKHQTCQCQGLDLLNTFMDTVGSWWYYYQHGW